jgi:hypothetical protein
MTREEKLATFTELFKKPYLKTGRVFADELANTARLLIDHPAGGRPWKVIGPAKDRGFWYLESAAPIGKVAGRMDYQRFRIYLHDTQFERTK